jgi:hypothetical protein
VEDAGEDLTYADLLLKHPHIRVVRPGKIAIEDRELPNIHSDDHLQVQITALNRTFMLHLQPDPDFVHPDASITIVRGPDDVVTKPMEARVYIGHVVDTPYSRTRAKWDAANIVGELFHSHDPSDPGLLNTLNPLGDMSYNPFVKSSDWNVGKARVVLYHDGLTKHDYYEQHYTNTMKPIFHASFDVHGDHYTVTPLHLYNAVRRTNDPPPRYFKSKYPKHDATMIAYRESDLARHHNRLYRRDVQTLSCGNGELQHNLNYRKWLNGIHQHDTGESFFSSSEDAVLNPQEKKRHLFKRASNECPSDLSMMYMGVAVDCTYARQFKKNEKDIVDNIIAVWGQVNYKYQSTFNVGIGIVRTVILMECGTETWNRECDTSFPIASRLSEFSKWRGSQQTDEGLWHLLSTCSTGPTLGIAWTGTICERNTRTQNSGKVGQEFVSGAGVSTLNRDQWKIVAHEIGHNFGAMHDCTSTDCSGGTADLTCSPCDTCDCSGRYIMNPTDKSTEDNFSQGSISDICRLIIQTSRSGKNCFGPPGSRRTLQGNVCGNGILEEGEQCDCGDSCATDACCTEKCTFKSGAVCSDRNNPGCCSKCQIKPAGSVCRPSREFCDIPEMCNGATAICPTDKYLPDGTGCRSNGTFPDSIKDQAYCAQGMCSNRNIQCYSTTKGKQVSPKGGCKQSQGDCQLACESSANSCIVFEGSFIDGTDCGFGGRCNKGTCSGSSICTLTHAHYFLQLIIRLTFRNIVNMIAGFVHANPIASAVAAGLLGLSILSCIYGCCIKQRLQSCKRRGKERAVRIPSSPQSAQNTPPSTNLNSNAAMSVRSTGGYPAQSNMHQSEALPSTQQAPVPYYQSEAISSTQEVPVPYYQSQSQTQLPQNLYAQSNIAYPPPSAPLPVGSYPGAASSSNPYGAPLPSGYNRNIFPPRRA